MNDSLSEANYSVSKLFNYVFINLDYEILIKEVDDAIFKGLFLKTFAVAA
ncbi:hypothetical protein SOVF_043760 [Spinacia oleracea]|nr:hypothetical protein SOVF_043760 [Spinacia oleracea]